MATEPIKKRILHVDDDSDTSIVVKTILEKAGYEVISKTSGKDVLEAVKKSKFDLVLLDIMMPDMSGWDLFNRLHTQDSNLKVAILSIIKLTSDKVDELMRSGLEDYITKPFERQDLVNRVKKIINKK